jgi:hypothetical protein
MTTPMTIRLTTSLILALVLGGCYYDKEEVLYPNSFCDTTNVTWSGTIQPLVQSRCATPGCHVTGAQSPDLSTYSAFKAQVDQGRIEARAIQGTPSFMPPSGKMPNCNIQQLQVWIDAGALQN